MKELYEEYCEERFGSKVIVTDAGFVVYELLEETHPPQLYIAEFHIARAHRASGKAFADLLGQLEAIARARGIGRLTGRVPFAAKNKEQALRNQLKYGFRILGVDQLTSITIEKKVEL